MCRGLRPFEQDLLETLQFLYGNCFVLSFPPAAAEPRPHARAAPLPGVCVPPLRRPRCRRAGLEGGCRGARALLGESSGAHGHVSQALGGSARESKGRLTRTRRCGAGRPGIRGVANAGAGRREDGVRGAGGARSSPGRTRGQARRKHYPASPLAGESHARARLRTPRCPPSSLSSAPVHASPRRPRPALFAPPRRLLASSPSLSLPTPR